ncbi:MHS family MFS transporter [Halomonas eurihalina]|uniref:MHS family MFS transporter n=1 Tax=Halomonas eurihalina TaxID=42566 RepID=A0A5D9DCW3_HALER|nr:MFS transporter [Halomonas eurihalina]MDR5858151.1 MFS transporter [Halomonas eurihalina]TZG41343.1 MHS family MFS transporter [Halomonas eurihalina]
MDTISEATSGSRTPPGTVHTTSSKHASFAAFSGSFIEWYDYSLYGTAAAVVFPQLFFPEGAGLVGAFGSFAAGFLARPVGALVFGHLGDRYGRKKMLLLSVLIMGMCTLLIGLLPTYQSSGWLAPALLVLLRTVQGFGIGGEFGGGALVALENAPSQKRGLMGSFHQMGTPAGILVATGVFSLVMLLPQETVMDWAWRLPFFLSGLFLVLALYIRDKLPETEVFQRSEDTKGAKQIPFISLLRQHPGALLLAVGARMCDAVTFNIVNVFGIAYATRELGLANEVMLTGFVISAGIQIGLIPIFGTLSDRIGRRPVYLSGTIVCAMAGLAYFPMLSLNSVWIAWLAIILTQAVGTGLMFSIQGTFFAELFTTKVRYTALGVVYQGSSLIGGAPTPLIALTLVGIAGSYWGAAVYVTAIAIMSFICTLFLTETYRSSILK